VRRSVVLALVVATLGFSHSSPVLAQPPGTGTKTATTMPAGWEFSGGELIWRSPTPVPLTDAGVEFYAGKRLLGRPEVAGDGRTFRLDAPSGHRFADLQVRTGGRRLDAPPAAAMREPTARPRPQATPRRTTGAVDPGKPGRFQTRRGEYTLKNVTLPGLPTPVEMKAVVVAPKGTWGRRPLALFLHGRHNTCFAGADVDKVSGNWPCPKGSTPIPSYRGYLRAQTLLASQGYDTVSIAANGISAQDDGVEDGGAQARSALVRLHLAHWSDWSGPGRRRAPDAVKAAPPADLTNVFLVGHSRGGEGVNQAAMDSLVPPVRDRNGYHGKVSWRVRGTLLIAPTAFGQNPAPDVPSATILPGCDGDVAGLEGQMYVDATRGLDRGKALHSAIYVEGANHNFFNTEWTPGLAQAPADDDLSDEDDPVCAPKLATRLKPAQQQAVGAGYVAAAAALFVRGDDRVRPLLDGTGQTAPSAGRAVVHTHALGGFRRPVVVPGARTKVTGKGGRLCNEVTLTVAARCLRKEDPTAKSPHFTRFQDLPSERGRYAVEMSWRVPRKTVSVRAAAARIVRGDKLALRVIVPANSTGTRLRVSVTDAKGHRSDQGTVTVDGLPGSDQSAALWGQELRVPLKGVTGAIKSLHLTPQTKSGQLWLLDAWAWRPGTPAPGRSFLPRVDVGTLSVDEGDSGTKKYTVPVRVSGSRSGTVQFFLTDPATLAVTTKTVTVRAGRSVVSIPVRIGGNTRYSETVVHTLKAKALTSSMVGAHSGTLEVRNDDPFPKVSLEPTGTQVKEGKTLTWRLRLSTAADSEINFTLTPRAPGTKPELSTTDVDPDWYSEATSDDAQPSRPLSGTELQLFEDIQPGAVTAKVTVPTVVDRKKEPQEHVAFEVTVWRDDDVPVGTVTGTVTDR
jgi:hypothetical protein